MCIPNHIRVRGRIARAIIRIILRTIILHIRLSDYVGIITTRRTNLYLNPNISISLRNRIRNRIIFTNQDTIIRRVHKCGHIVRARNRTSCLAVCVSRLVVCVVLFDLALIVLLLPLLYVSISLIVLVLDYATILLFV